MSTLCIYIFFSFKYKTNRSGNHSNFRRKLRLLRFRLQRLGRFGQWRHQFQLWRHKPALHLRFGPASLQKIETADVGHPNFPHRHPEGRHDNRSHLVRVVWRHLVVEFFWKHFRGWVKRKEIIQKGFCSLLELYFLLFFNMD